MLSGQQRLDSLRFHWLNQWRRKQFASAMPAAENFLMCTPSLFSCATHIRGRNDCLLPTERHWSVP